MSSNTADYRHTARTRRISTLVLFICGTGAWPSSAQQSKNVFTVKDEIGLTLFTTPNGGPAEVQFSPDGKFAAVWSERGELDTKLVVDSLRFYRIDEIRNFLRHSEMVEPPNPVWTMERAAPEGEVIGKWRWLSDSSGIAYLEGAGIWNTKKLALADLLTHTVQYLTPVTQGVTNFEVNDRRHYVYTQAGDVEGAKKEDESETTFVVGTNHSLDELIFPNNRVVRGYHRRKIGDLWAVVDGRRFEVKTDGKRISPAWYDLALSPDGKSLVCDLRVSEVPSNWEKLYPHVAGLNLIKQEMWQYALVNLETGSVTALTDAPASISAGWIVGGKPAWSKDGGHILLPGTFLRSKDPAPSRPCVAVVDWPVKTSTCVETLKRRTGTGVEEGYHEVGDVRFVDKDPRRVSVVFTEYRSGTAGSTQYEMSNDGRWQALGQSKNDKADLSDGIDVSVSQSFSEPPTLVANDAQTSRTIWDPNPQLKRFDLGQATGFKWKTKEGRELKGGLFKPPSYKPGQRYPLVIQGHGFVENEFRPSGVFTTAFAARALAAAGIMVLQVQEDDCSPQAQGCDCPEGPCEVSEYEAAIKQLVSDELVDPDRVGIIGFSRTCFYVMEALTAGSPRLRAASITDGVMEDYLQYMLFPELLAEDSNELMGAAPFGPGLQEWLKRSPGFNLEKINTPLLVVGLGPLSMLYMWPPYSALLYLHRPVDVLMLNTDEHVLTNPAERLVSQGGSVDWFRFWLQDYEDPDSTKAEQYKRWRALRKLQEKN